MQDPRLEKLANVLINHSTRVKTGETVLIEAIDIPDEMVIALIRRVRAAGGVPLVTLKKNRVQRELIWDCAAEDMQKMGEYEAFRMQKVQAYIGVRGSMNISEMSDVPMTCVPPRSTGSSRCISKSACQEQNGWCCVGQPLPWRNKHR